MRSRNARCPLKGRQGLAAVPGTPTRLIRCRPARLNDFRFRRRTRRPLLARGGRQLNDVESALGLLGPLLASGQAAELVTSARSDPDVDPIRNDPRFQTILAETEARQAAAKEADGTVAPESA